jgi:hypothetical protein
MTNWGLLPSLVIRLAQHPMVSVAHGWFSQASVLVQNLIRTPTVVCAKPWHASCVLVESTFLPRILTTRSSVVKTLAQECAGPRSEYNGLEMSFMGLT